MLKNNFLYHQDIRNIQDLERKAKFYFTQHKVFAESEAAHSPEVVSFDQGQNAKLVHSKPETPRISGSTGQA